MILNKNKATPRPRTFDKTNHNDEVKAVLENSSIKLLRRPKFP